MRDKHYYVTEKLDGSSATYYYRDGVFGVCSRNLELLESDYAAQGITKVVTAQGITYRIPKK